MSYRSILTYTRVCGDATADGLSPTTLPPTSDAGHQKKAPRSLTTSVQLASGPIICQKTSQKSGKHTHSPPYIVKGTIKDTGEGPDERHRVRSGSVRPLH